MAKLSFGLTAFHVVGAPAKYAKEDCSLRQISGRHDPVGSVCGRIYDPITHAREGRAAVGHTGEVCARLCEGMRHSTAITYVVAFSPVSTTPLYTWTTPTSWQECSLFTSRATRPSCSSPSFLEVWSPAEWRLLPPHYRRVSTSDNVPQDRQTQEPLGLHRQHEAEERLDCAVVEVSPILGVGIV